MPTRTLWVLILAVCSFAVCLPVARGNDFTDWLLGRTNKGSNDCTWDGCQCCDDYCPKARPCMFPLPTCCPDDYCKKQWPCVPKLCPSCCPDYCKKPWPCVWKPMCGPFNWCGPKGNNDPACPCAP